MDGPDGTTTFDVDDLGALRSVLLAEGRRIDYVIDAGGRRIGRMVDGVLTDGYLYSVDDSIVAWTDGSGQVIARFAYDDLGRLALVRREGRNWPWSPTKSARPIALVDSQTGEVSAFTYDAWGNPLDGTSSALIPFGFAGGLVDPDTGLLHFGARDYDPSIGRWTAPDPLRYAGGDINLYRYASGDPVNFIDPTGTSACAPTVVEVRVAMGRCMQEWAAESGGLVRSAAARAVEARALVVAAASGAPTTTRDRKSHRPEAASRPSRSGLEPLSSPPRVWSPPSGPGKPTGMRFRRL